MKGVVFKYLPTDQSIVIETKTPKHIQRKLKRLLKDKPVFQSDAIYIDPEKISLIMPVRKKYRLDLLPDSPEDVDYILLFSDEIVDYIHSMYRGILEGLEKIETDLYYLKKYIGKVKREMKIFKDIESLKDKLNPDSYYYISSYLKTLNYQLYQFTLQKRELETTRKLLLLLLDVLHHFTIKIVTSYPMINVDYVDDKYVINVNDTRISVRDEVYSDVRELLEKNKDVFKKALIMYKSDIMNDINKIQNETIQTQAVINDYQNILEDIKNSEIEGKKKYMKLVQKDIESLKRNVKEQEKQIGELKSLINATNSFMKEYLGGESDEGV